MALSGTDNLVVRSLGHGLLVAYLVDEGDHFTYVQHRHLIAAGLNADELHNCALQNLESFAEQHAELRSSGDIYVVFAGGTSRRASCCSTSFGRAGMGTSLPMGSLRRSPRAISSLSPTLPLLRPSPNYVRSARERRDKWIIH
jgi:hypothetical protein